MKNDLLTIGGLTVHGYGLMIGIGFIAAYLMTEFRARKYRMNTDIVFTLFISSVVFGLLGAKVLYYLTILDRVIKDPGVILDEMEGFVVYGGIIGGVLAGYVVCRIKKEKFWQYFDLIAPEGLDVCLRGAVMEKRRIHRFPLHSTHPILHQMMWR